MRVDHVSSCAWVIVLIFNSCIIKSSFSIAINLSQLSLDSTLFSFSLLLLSIIEHFMSHRIMSRFNRCLINCVRRILIVLLSYISIRIIALMSFSVVALSYLTNVEKYRLITFRIHVNLLTFIWSDTREINRSLQHAHVRALIQQFKRDDLHRAASRHALKIACSLQQWTTIQKTHVISWSRFFEMS